MFHNHSIHHTLKLYLTKNNFFNSPYKNGSNTQNKHNYKYKQKYKREKKDNRHKRSSETIVNRPPASTF